MKKKILQFGDKYRKLSNKKIRKTKTIIIKHFYIIYFFTHF